MKRLINCPDCGHEISNKAEACPPCGRPSLDALRGKKIEEIVGGLTALAVIAFLIYKYLL